jgi:hypothetical protein
MKHPLNISIFSAMLAVLSACGTGGGDGVSVTGVAVDGYLYKATVFLDLNDNGVYDSGEPTATTDAKGAFTFTASQSQIAAHKVIVLAVAGTTVDQDSPSATINKSYTMMSPAGSTDVISPLTTHVAAKMDADKTLTLAAAKSAVQADLGLATVDVMKNYVAEKVTSADYAKAHNVAASMAEVLKTVEDESSKDTKVSNKLVNLSSKVTTQIVPKLAEIKIAKTPTEASAVAETDASVIAVVADIPYGTSITDTAQFEKLPAFIKALNSDTSLSAVLHLGDIHSGKEPCTQAYDQSILDAWKKLILPLVFTPGDNEWADCHKSKQYGGAYNSSLNAIEYFITSTVKSTTGTFFSYFGGDPIKNLDLVRSLFFADSTLTKSIDIHSQATEYNTAFTPDAKYKENVWFMKSGVLVVTMNIPGGSNNDNDIWYGAPTMTDAQKTEITERSAANIRWLNSAFVKAKDKGAVGVLIQVQGDMWDIDGASGVSHLSEYKQFVDVIASNALTFGKPVLLFNGDSHKFRFDNPLKSGQPCYTEPTTGSTAIEACTTSNIVSASYSIDPYTNNQPGATYSVPNFRRIVARGSTGTVSGYPMEYLRLKINPKANVTTDNKNAFGPFSWERIQPQ